MYYIVGLGNPGEEYKLSRHSTGRIIADDFRKSQKFGEFETNKKLSALFCEGKIKKEKLMLILPEKYMNNSGKSVAPVIKSKKAAGNLIVVHDDLDLPLGKFKISFGSGSAGHKGVESIMRAVKTKDFIRIKVGISPATTSGKIKKPQGKKVIDYILGNFKPQELKIIKKVSKKISEAMASILTDGLNKTMSIYGSR